MRIERKTRSIAGHFCLLGTITRHARKEEILPKLPTCVVEIETSRGNGRKVQGKKVLEHVFFAEVLMYGMDTPKKVLYFFFFWSRWNNRMIVAEG